MGIKSIGVQIGAIISSLIVLGLIIRVIISLINPSPENIGGVIEYYAIPFWIVPLQWISKIFGLFGLIAIFLFLKWIKQI